MRDATHPLQTVSGRRLGPRRPQNPGLEAISGHDGDAAVPAATAAAADDAW